MKTSPIENFKVMSVEPVSKMSAADDSSLNLEVKRHPLPADPLVRRVVRIALVGDPIASERESLAMLVDLLKSGVVAPDQQARLGRQLERIAEGEDPKTVFGLKRERFEPRDPDRTTLIALDYVLRSRVRPSSSKIAANVAHDWDEASVDTVKQIHRRMKDVAAQILDDFEASEARRRDYSTPRSLELYAEAITAAREQILSGDTSYTFAPIEKSPEETIECTYDFAHYVRFYSLCE